MARRLYARYSVSRIVARHKVFTYDDAYLVPLAMDSAMIVDRIGGSHWLDRSRRLPGVTSPLLIEYTIILPHSLGCLIRHFKHDFKDELVLFDGHSLEGQNCDIFEVWRARDVIDGAPAGMEVLQFKD